MATDKKMNLYELEDDEDKKLSPVEEVVAENEAGKTESSGPLNLENDQIPGLKTEDVVPPQYFDNNYFKPKMAEVDDNLSPGDFKPEALSDAPAPQSAAPAQPSEIDSDKIKDTVQQNLSSGKSPEASSPSDAVKQVIMSRMGMPATGMGLDMDTLKAAQGQSAFNRLAAQLGEAGQNLGYGIARAGQPNPDFYRNLEKTANEPVQNLAEQLNFTKQGIGLQQRQRLYDPNSMESKVARSLMAARLKDADADPKTIDGLLNPGENGQMLSAAQVSGFEKATAGLEGAALKHAMINSQAQLRQAMLGRQDQRIGIQRDRLALAQGNQAAGVAKTFNNDPIIKTGANQLSLIDKIEGRISDIKSGKLPFTNIVKNEIESDLSQIVSNTSSSNQALGRLERQEFNPVSAGWARVMGNIKGLPQDIGTPQYLGQIETLLGGMKRDVLGIRQKRGSYLQQSFGGAYGSNPLAQGVLDTNAGLTRAPQAQDSSEGMVQIKLSNGKTGSIPKANLDAAKKRDPNLQVIQ